MPRFFFHASEDGEIVDSDERELADASAARGAVVDYAAAFLQGAGASALDLELHVAVADEGGVKIGELTISPAGPV